MRVGNNPEKEKSILKVDSYHRIIIPIYIPNLKEDYFKDSLKILKLCLDSLLLTIHSKTKISLINNGCCNEVKVYLENIYSSNIHIDQLLNSKINLGKVNALYSAIKSNLEPIVTISDADVMFLPNWQKEVENIINGMPQAGMVSPVPSSLGYRNEAINSTVYYGFFRGKMQFSDVVNPEGLKNFQNSIGRENMYNEQHLKKYLTISNKKVKAVLGCGHFVATFRSEVFKNAPNEVCKFKIVGGSEGDYLDFPNDKGGFLRLATLGNFAYHLGNKQEDWMIDEFKKINSTTINHVLLLELTTLKTISRFGYFIGMIFRKVFLKKIKKQFFNFKGMKKSF